MRICYIADALSLHTQRWVNYSVKKGHDVHLITWRGGEGFDEGLQLHFLTRLAPCIWPVSKYPSALLWLGQARRLVKRIKPDILVSHYITTYGYLGTFSGFHPMILVAWGSDVLVDPQRNLLWKIFTKYALSHTDAAVICDSTTVKDKLLGLGTTPSKIMLVCNGVDTQQFSPRRRNKELRNRLGLSEWPIVTCIRRLAPIYNVEMLIRAIPLVLKQVPEAKFIVGCRNDEQGDYLESLAGSLGVSDSVRFLGWIEHDELPEYLATSDIYVSTSLSDGTSVSLQEAMACELVPVVTDLPSNREWVKDGKNGFVVPQRDTQMLAEKIIYLLKNREIRERFGKLGRQAIVEGAEYVKEMEKMDRFYRWLELSKEKNGKGEKDKDADTGGENILSRRG